MEERENSIQNSLILIMSSEQITQAIGEHLIQNSWITE